MAAVRENRRPFLAIQCCAAIAVVSYYLIPGVPTATATFGAFKVRGGMPFAAASTALAGAGLPAVAKALTAKHRKEPATSEWVFQILFFSTLGIIVDGLYRLLALLLGGQTSPTVVLEKVVIDQGIFSPLVSIPISATAFLWKDAGYSWIKTRESIASGEWICRYASLLVMCWTFWVPVLGCVYAMPADLQFLLFLCAEGAWALLLLTISGR